jgi:hypothetical protein
LLLSLSLAALLGCDASSTPPAAESQPLAAQASDSDVNARVEAAIRKHLAKRSDLDMASMELTIDHVDVQGESAQATVGFRVKDTPEAAMSMNYQLVKEAGEWVVQPAAAGHGATPPPAAPGQGLPPGHPPAGGAQPPQPLPPGHPPVAQ